MLKPDLFMLHYAGGNIYSFNFIKPYLEDWFNLIFIELPGRGKRVREKLLLDRDLAIEDILEQILNKLDSNPFLIYGHSMGASLGFEVVKRLEEKGKLPLCFIASGNSGPNIKSNIQRYDLPKEEFISELKSLGGIDDQVINDSQLFNFFEPVLRADFEVVEKERNIPNCMKISTPIYACMGIEEEHSADIENWREYTSNNFESKLFEGNHFFIHRHSVEMAQIIKNCYKKYKSMTSN